MADYTKVAKPTDSTYTKVAKAGQSYDSSSITYDDSTVSYN